MANGQNLQQDFLAKLQQDKTPVSIFLVNGIKLQGHIESFDDSVIMLDNSIKQMVFKHAISTVVPNRDMQPK